MGFLPFLFGLENTSAGDFIFKLTAGPAPTFVALILVFATYTREHRKDYFRRIINFKQMGVKWPFLVILFFIIECGAIIFVSTFFGGKIPEFTGIRTLIHQPYMIFLYLLIAVMSGPMNEEFGWRGFALDRLVVRYGFWIGSIILGFIWGIWHLPWYFYPGNAQYIFWYVSPIHGIAYIVSTITLSCVISIVYFKTNRSILSAFFVHMISNFFTGGVLHGATDEKYNIVYIYVSIALQLLVIIYFKNNPKFKYEINEQIASINKSEK
jgi:membrane protease YdiL (CAAX protease family)